MNNKILHIFPYEKFTVDYVNRICELFDSAEHIFYIYIYDSCAEISIKKEFCAEAQIIYESKYNIVTAKKLVNLCKKSKKCIFHSLFIPPVFLIMCSLYINRYKDKAIWNIWGADLYDAYKSRKINILHRLKEVFRRRFIKKVHSVVCIRGDYEFLTSHYKTKALFLSAPYSYDFVDIPTDTKSETINILIGNSATETCRHMGAIDMIAPYRERNIKVFCVLSYPKSNDEYRNSVIEYGKQMLGDKFLPIVDYIFYEEYVKLLSSIDIAIFNHDRQQAFGNIVNLLFYGKRVFVSSLNACGDYCREIGAVVYSTDELCADDIKKVDTTELKLKSQGAIRQYFSDDSYRDMWNTVFNC